MISNNTKIDYTSFNLGQFIFRDEIKKNLYDTIMSFIFKFIGYDWYLSGIRLQSGKQAGLQILGEAIGFTENTYKSLLSYHQDRLSLSRRIIYTIYLPLEIFLILPIALIFAKYSIYLKSNAFIVVFLSYLYLFVGLHYAMRLIKFLIRRYFSDSMCIQTLIYLIIELARCNKLMTPSQKRKLLNRTDILVKENRSLVSFFDPEDATLDWALTHFRHIEAFIKEREKWIIAPRESTLEDLQQDIYHFAVMYISGNFGNFDHDPYKVGKDDLSKSSSKNSFIGVLQFAFGIIVPVVGVLIIALRPGWIPITIDHQVLFLICIGWLLLAIDGSLKLGIVANVMGIAKGIKDLA